MQLATLLCGGFSLWKGKNTMRFWPGGEGLDSAPLALSLLAWEEDSPVLVFSELPWAFLLHFNPALLVCPTLKLLLRLHSLLHFVLFSLPPGEPSPPCRPGASSAPAGRARSCTGGSRGWSALGSRHTRTHRVHAGDAHTRPSEELLLLSPFLCLKASKFQSYNNSQGRDSHFPFQGRFPPSFKAGHSPVLSKPKERAVGICFWLLPDITCHGHYPFPAGCKNSVRFDTCHSSQRMETFGAHISAGGREEISQSQHVFAQRGQRNPAPPVPT